LVTNHHATVLHVKRKNPGTFLPARLYDSTN